MLEWLVDNGYYEGRVVARRNAASPAADDTTVETPVDLTLRHRDRPAHRTGHHGIAVPDTIRRQLIAAWVDVPADALLREEFADAPAAVAG